MYFDATTVENTDRLYTDNELTTKLKATLGDNEYDVTLYRYSTYVLEIGGNYYYPLMIEDSDSELHYIKDGNGGRLYELIHSSKSSELYSIKNGVATDTEIDINGLTE